MLILRDRLGDGAADVDAVVSNDHAGPALVRHSTRRPPAGRRGAGPGRHPLGHVGLDQQLLPPPLVGAGGRDRSGCVRHRHTRVPVVVGTDGSAHGKVAVSWAAAQAAARGSDLQVLVTWNVPAAIAGAVIDPTAFEEEAAQVLKTRWPTWPQPTRRHRPSPVRSSSVAPPRPSSRHRTMPPSRCWAAAVGAASAHCCSARPASRSPPMPTARSSSCPAGGRPPSSTSGQPTGGVVARARSRPARIGAHCRTVVAMTRLGYQIPNFTYPGRDPGRAVRRHPAPGGRGRPERLRHRVGDGPLLPTADAGPPGPGDARVLHAAVGAGPTHRQRAVVGAGDRQHVPGPDAAGQDHHHARCRVAGSGPARASAPGGSSWSTTRSASSSAPSPIGSRSWRRRSRSSPGCCTANGRRWRASGTRCPTPSTSPLRWAGSRS